jgi:hypothetical protein
MLAIAIATTVLGELLRPKPKFDQPQPSALGDFQLPTAQEGRAIPYVAGTCEVKGPNVTWWGDLNVYAIRQHVKTGLFSSEWITKGYKYYLGAQLVLCHGVVDALLGIRSSNKNVSYVLGSVSYRGDYSATTDYLMGDVIHYTDGKYYRARKDTTGVAPDTVLGGIVPIGAVTWDLIDYTPGSGVVYSDEIVLSITDPDLYGGVDQEGGLAGTVVFYRGTQTQTSDSYLTQVQGRVSPNFRGICYAVFQGLYVGTSPYVKAISFVIKRLPNPFGYTDGTHDINDGDANPALVAYELLTSTMFGLATPPSRIDTASFDRAAHTLKDEGLGISMQVDTPAAADQILGDICRHMDGVIFTDPSTGLWTLALARQDYDPTTLLVLDQDSVLETPVFSRASWTETLNEIKIQYVDRHQDFTPRLSVPAQDLANISVTREVRSATINFLGISNRNTAALVAMRVLKTYSFPVSKIQIVTNRSAWNLRPAQCFKFSYPPLGITNQIFRGVQIQYGELVQGKITIDATEDIFGINDSFFVAPPSGWESPNKAPQPVAAQELEEVPYQLNPEGRAVMVLAARGDTISTTCDVYVDSAYSLTLPTFTPTGTLASDYPKWTLAEDSTGFDLDAVGAIDLGVLASTDATGLQNGVNLLLIDSEIMSWQTITAHPDGSATISGILRGAYDTVPAAHSAGSRVWFFSDGAGLTRNDPYLTDVSLTVQLTPRTSSEVLPLSSATPMSITTNSRSLDPLPPGNLHLRSYAYATWMTTTLGDVAINWNYRNRLTQTTEGVVVPQDAGDVDAPEGNFTATVYIGGTLKRTLAAISGKTFSYTVAQRIADDADGSKSVVIHIAPVNGSLDGNENFTPAFTMTGFGLDFGHHFGGTES